MNLLNSTLAITFFRSNLLRPLTSHEPEGMWNLLSIVRELFQHRDPNSIELLQLLTQECLSFEQIVVWWFNSRSQGSGRKPHSFRRNDHDSYKSNINTASTEMTKHACASFCDELVVLWRLACLDPRLSCDERLELKERLEQWQNKTIEKARNGRHFKHFLAIFLLSYSFSFSSFIFSFFLSFFHSFIISFSTVLFPSSPHRISPTASGNLGN